ncbi:MAG: sel1 repeat family protein [Magnetococcales bacterium]|nr:sel1 repeat family protein [Magnetococcales bacterium]
MIEASVGEDDADEQNRIGILYFHGQGVVQDSAEAVARFRRAADQGHAAAQYNLGGMYYSGNGVPQDSVAARRWFLMAAQQGHAEAQFMLGNMYRQGDGGAQDHREAEYWFRLAAEQGQSDTQPKTKAEAIEWLHHAAAQGDARAQYMLDLVHYHGSGMTQDDGQVIVVAQPANRKLYHSAVVLTAVLIASLFGYHWYREQLPAEPLQLEASNNSGLLYFYGQGVTQDYQAAVQWFQKAAEQGYAVAQFNLAGLYHDGRGVAQDNAQAASWYRRAANQGYAHAQNNLGLIYYYGQGVTQDDIEAAQWLRRAADQGHVLAQSNLAILYLYGQGVQQSDVQAYKWWQLAARYGDQEAGGWGEQLAKSMAPDQLHQAEQLVRHWRPK